jgi:hypothetical protein
VSLWRGALLRDLLGKTLVLSLHHSLLLLLLLLMLLLLILLLLLLLVLLLLTLSRHLRRLRRLVLLLVDIRKVHIRVLIRVLLLHGVVLLHPLCHKGLRPLCCNVGFISSAVVTTAIDGLGLRVVGDGLLITSSLCLDGHIWEVERVLRRRHWWEVIVCLDIRRHCRRLSRQLRLRIPRELRNLESRQLLLPALVVCQSIAHPLSNVQQQEGCRHMTGYAALGRDFLGLAGLRS